MAYHVLARKWRPGKFADLVGQEHVVSAISNALDNHRLHHAYLFTGTRGVGKTTIARIFAKSLNCEKGMTSNPCGNCGNCQDIEAGRFVDLLEIDAASRTKVEDTRELLDNVQYKPTRGEYKVYLIDEVHMLSKHSFNALLKTLEEPPPHIKFLLATTDPQKLPITILSRCLQFNLKALTREQISQQLQHVLSQEQLPFDMPALVEIAKAAQGSMRDALSLTDQAIAQGNGNITSQVVADMLGLMDRNQVLKLLHAVLAKEQNKVFALVDEIAAQAPDYSQLMAEMLVLLHQVALTQYVPEACKLESSSAKAIYYLASKIPPEMVQLQYQILLQGRKDLPYAVDGRSGLEMTLLRMLAFTPDENNRTLQDFPFSDAVAEKKTVDFIASSECIVDFQEETGEPSSDNTEQAHKPVHVEPVPTVSAASAHQSFNTVASENIEPVNNEQDEQSNGDIVAEQKLNDEMSAIIEQAEHLQSSNEMAQHRHDESASVTNFSEEDTSADIEQENNNAADAQASEQYLGAEQSESQDPYFHPEDLQSYEQLDGDAVAQLQALDELNAFSTYAEGETSEVQSGQTASALVPDTSPNEQQQILDTHALLDIHSSLQQSVAQEEDDTDSSDTLPQTQQNRLASFTAADSPPLHDDAGITQVSGDNKVAAEDELPAKVDADFEADQEIAADLEQCEPISDNPFKQRPVSNIGEGEQADTYEPEEQDFSDDESGDESIDFDVPLELDGKKVVAARQLDTWSQLIEQAGLTGLPKQIVLHSNYVKEGDRIKLTLNPHKKHLISDANKQTIAEALSQVLQQDITVAIEVGEVKDTPFSVQKAIDRVRLNHAKEVIHSDPIVQRLQQQFAASVIEESIKPR